MAAGKAKVRAPKPLVAGNWKMNGLRSAKKEINALAKKLNKLERLPCDVLICPPTPTLALLVETAKGSKVRIGGQDCHPQVSGAHTGDVSAEMLKDVGAKYVIVGHSERRADHEETNTLVAQKAAAGHRAGLISIVCVGETEAERDAGKTLSVITAQLKGSLGDTFDPKNTVIAYEPVWAIGTGRTPTTAEVGQVHTHIRKRLVARYGEQGNGYRVLYGGSVKPANAEELMAAPNVNGALVGGASLTAEDFYGIISAYL